MRIGAAHLVSNTTMIGMLPRVPIRIQVLERLPIRDAMLSACTWQQAIEAIAAILRASHSAQSLREMYCEPGRRRSSRSRSKT